MHRAPTPTATTRTPAATSTRATRRRSTSAPTWTHAPARVPERGRLGRGPLARQQRRALPERRTATAASGSIRVAAEADWPQQSRLIEFFDNRDGTLSIFGTIVDHASPATAPPAGTAACRLRRPTTSPRSAAPSPTTTPSRAAARATPAPAARARRDDRNVELIVGDPRTGSGGGGGNGGSAGGGPARCPSTIQGGTGDERLVGTAGDDRIDGADGRDRISGGKGRDCLQGGPDHDRVKGGADADRVAGGPGRDRLKGNGGRDKIRSGGGRDRINAADGERDRVVCGGGRDRAVVDRKDRVRGCEAVKLRGRSHN